MWDGPKNIHAQPTDTDNSEVMSRGKERGEAGEMGTLVTVYTRKVKLKKRRLNVTIEVCKNVYGLALTDTTHGDSYSLTNFLNAIGIVPATIQPYCPPETPDRRYGIYLFFYSGGELRNKISKTPENGVLKVETMTNYGETGAKGAFHSWHSACLLCSLRRPRCPSPGWAGLEEGKSSKDAERRGKTQWVSWCSN